MKPNILNLFNSVNPYRDWFLVLIFLLLSASFLAIVDARLFLRAVGGNVMEEKKFSAEEFDKGELVRVAEQFREKERKFNELK